MQDIQKIIDSLQWNAPNDHKYDQLCLLEKYIHFLENICIKYKSLGEFVDYTKEKLWEDFYSDKV